MQGLMQVAGFLLTIGVTYGLVFLLLGLLNLRDRRQSRLLGTVMRQLPWRDFLGRFAVQVRCALLSPRGVVTVTLRACSRDELWDVIERLFRNLPPHVRLVVDGTGTPRFPARFTVETAPRPPASDPCAAPWRPARHSGIGRR